MSDLREQLLKAGLVSEKQARQSKHEQRVHRKEAGQTGLQQEQTDRERAQREEQEEKRRQDRERERQARQQAAELERNQALMRRIQAGWLRDATGGGRRFFFMADAHRITYLDLTDQAGRRLQNGSAAIVSASGAVRGEFCVVDGTTAAALARDHPEVIRYWQRQ